LENCPVLRSIVPPETLRPVLVISVIDAAVIDRVEAPARR